MNLNKYTNLFVTKTGRIELDDPIKVENIRLYCITLYMDMYNLTESTEYVYRGNTITIQPGYYALDDLQKEMVDLKVDEKTFKVSYNGTLTGGLTKLIKNDRLYLHPLSLYLHVDGINTEKNLLDGKRSNVLSAIPVGKTNAGEIVVYEPREAYAPMNMGEINSLTVELKDERGNDYSGKFLAKFIIQ